jgi:hypothetical protein
LLQELNGLLAPAEAQVAARFTTPRYPVLLVMGVPRSGTTLMMQWLASLGHFAYPSNLISRFYAAPYIGARIQQLLTDPAYRFGDEIPDFARELDYSSALGKTRGVLAPNEFWYFWRRFFPVTEPRYLEPHELAQVDREGFSAELAALESAFDKPLALKGLILSLNIPFLASLLPQALFVYIRRHPFYTIQSLLQARERYFGTRETWYSIRPPETEQLQHLDPIEQVAGQVAYTMRGIEEGLAAIDPARRLVVSYEAFCAGPEVVYAGIVAHYAAQGYALPPVYTGPAHFDATNQVQLSSPERDAALAAYSRFAGENLSL